ncbi:MAG: CDP-diacylglycerol--glycerol-3-phosphate 3-phosphatidyltransferase [Clostridia bacterium]|nr:CDP-diacylglycerol--glycerol-3-phosphate 3-phosphatidyltransferase [Clostridia bacterium]
MTTANKITIFRILMIPLFLVLIYSGASYWALAVYILACVSDTVDGYVARHYHQVTDFGKFMDPLADKMLVLSAMCYFVEISQMPGWIVAAVLFREFAVSGLRLVSVEQGRVIAAGWSGKLKTTVTMIGIVCMLAFPQSDIGNWIWNILILTTTIGSGVEYFWKNRDVFHKL